MENSEPIQADKQSILLSVMFAVVAIACNAINSMMTAMMLLVVVDEILLGYCESCGLQFCNISIEFHVTIVSAFQHSE